MAVVLVVIGAGLALGLGVGLLLVIMTVAEARSSATSLKEARIQYRALSAAVEIQRVGYETERAMWAAVAQQPRSGGTP